MYAPRLYTKSVGLEAVSSSLALQLKNTVLSPYHGKTPSTAHFAALLLGTSFLGTPFL